MRLMHASCMSLMQLICASAYKNYIPLITYKSSRLYMYMYMYCTCEVPEYGLLFSPLLQAWVFIMLSGQMWNHIRGPPFAHRNPQTGEMVSLVVPEPSIESATDICRHREKSIFPLCYQIMRYVLGWWNLSS